MDKIDIGKLIKDRRISLSKSQSDVCEGICDVSTFSRIERGLIDTSHDTLIQLFERLSLSTEWLINAVSEKDDAIRQVIRQANRADVSGNREQAWTLLSSICDDYDSFSLANKQRFDVLDTKLTYEEGDITLEERLNNMVKALRMTVPSYSLNNLPILMTDMESLILRYIANSYTMAEDYSDAIVIYYHLKNWENSRSDKIAASKKLVRICYNLSKCLGMLGKYDESISVAREGICSCEYADNILMLPSCMYNCVWSLVRRNNTGDIEEAKELIDEMSGLYTTKTWNIDGLKEGVDRIEKEYFH